ncbi:HWE histidine kinase domain-containing protein [Cognatishimia sp. SS12]|uniref:HWE histidine kinase domain-containing protein n=1 Tax=Cognatishimia sp. SS12 TaxID=2979465 RepID=UPI00232E7327|nr:HWE histidine kinase domain-containing protein [Cognatishimia sp. SS12]MDC0737839.1 HWE histidine kinase domain-containing protein [Cognatishimia sp. SS12]
MSDHNTSGPEPEYDLTTCDQEPIHIIGTVQDFGCLLAVSTDWIVTHFSANCPEILGCDGDMLGRPISEFLTPQALHDLRTRMQMLQIDDKPVRVFAYDLKGDGQLFDISVHTSERRFVFEFEPRGTSPQDVYDPALVQALIARVQRHDTLDALAHEAARGLRNLSGFDRVMVYKFEEDGSGHVIAEARKPDVEPFLGLRYPASDIPKQARELYKRSLLRIIPDVDAPVHPVRPERDPMGAPLDMSLAVTRAVSPIHLEYLGNMGVAASMSVSILRNGELWGLLACHHYAPHYISYEKRTSVELFAQLFNYELAQLEMQDELGDVERARGMHDRLLPQFSSGRGLVDVFKDLCREMSGAVAFDGAVIYSDGDYRHTGTVPTLAEMDALARFLNACPPGQIYTTDQLGAFYDGAGAIADRVAGLLAIPISRKPRDYLVLFRREVVKSVVWAGNPTKPVETNENGRRLTPRKSFQAWKEMARGQSQPWHPRELRIAEALRTTLIEAVLKQADETNAERKRAQDQQELLIAELNHRVRNILNLIRGLVSQGRETEGSVEKFGAVLDERIHALARAHDQLNQSEWDWSPLAGLIAAETDAFLAGKASRVRVTGSAVELSPDAFTCLALVVHELVTNSAKYGALSDSSGQVNISIDMLPNGAVSLTWRERDGPAVAPPKRKGFGTTIIEKSIPFELGGTAEVRYETTGLEADFTIPKAQARPAEGEVTVPRDSAQEVDHMPVKFHGNALVIEDNMIIALDVVDMLTHLGARSVETASRVSTARDILANGQVDFVLADLNLGSETSLPVVEECVASGVPVVLATGYADTDEITASVRASYKDLKILKKPYTIEQLSSVLSQVLGTDNTT